MNCRAFCLALFFLCWWGEGYSRACSIPVFRYALERWDLGSYEILVYHRGPFTKEETGLVRQLEDISSGANVVLTRVDLAEKVDPNLQKTWEKYGKDKTLPWALVRPPHADLLSPVLWSGPFSPETFPRSKILDSPVRQQLIQQLARGVSAVFLLLESGDARADAAAVQLLERELADLGKKVRLPEPDPDGPQLRYPLALQVAFPVVKLSRNDPAEEFFRNFLLHSEEGLVDVKGPIVYPIFGRGRLLCSLAGADLNAEQLATVVRFVCGACSCQVKDLNPGIDLLLAADWPSILEGSHQGAALADQVTEFLLPGLDYLDVDTDRFSLDKISQGWERVMDWTSWALGKIDTKERARTSPNPDPGKIQSSNSSPSSIPEVQEVEERNLNSPTPRVWLWWGTGLAFMLVLVTGVWAWREK